MTKRKYPKLRGKTRELAGKYIARQTRKRKYTREQAIAIGISQARTATKKSSRSAEIAAIMERYR